MWRVDLFKIIEIPIYLSYGKSPIKIQEFLFAELPASSIVKGDTMLKSKIGVIGTYSDNNFSTSD